MSKPKVIGIVGSRGRDEPTDYMSCLGAFKRLYRQGDSIVSGGCPKGGDRFAEKIAKECGVTITIHHPNWSKFGRRAGFERNGRIAEECDVLIALCAAGHLGGTDDTVRKVTELGKKVVYA